MLRSSFLWKLFAGYALLILVTVSVSGTLLAVAIKRDFLAETARSLREKATLLQDILAPLLTGENDRGLREKVQALGQRLDTRITVIREDGRVTADSQRNPDRMDDHSDRPEIRMAAEAGEGTSTRRSDSVEVDALYLALQVRREGKVLGYIRASLPLTLVAGRIDELQGLIFTGGAVGFLVALLLAFTLARRVTAPLVALTTATEAFAQGDHSRRFEGKPGGEVGKLAHAFNRMAQQLQSRLETITRDRNKLLTILGGMEEGVVAVDMEERVIHINAMAANILDTPPMSCLGKRIWEVTRLRDIPEALSQCVSLRREVTSEAHILGRTRTRTIELHASPLHGTQERLAGAVAVLHDVTELRQAEAVRRDFVANVSHELKTPITAIRGLAETLLDDPEMPPETRNSFMNKVKDQALRLSALVTDLLALARLEGTTPPFDPVPIDLREPVLAALQALKSVAEDRGVALESSLPEEPIRVLGEVQALQQLAANLLDNALNYTPRAGRVCIRLGTEESHAVLEVQDTGIGIEPRHQVRIFERFYRVDKSRSRELGGTGLGLAIVKHICQTHGGEVTVESAPGTGSTFRVELPLARRT